MTSKEFRTLLADYLAGELREEQRAAVEAHLASSPDDRAEVEALRRTQSMIGAALISRPEADRRVAERWTASDFSAAAVTRVGPGVHSASGLAAAALRYAALIGLAFLGGMWAERQWGMRPDVSPAHSGGALIQPDRLAQDGAAYAPPDLLAGASPEFVRAAVRTAQAYPGLDPVALATLALGSR
jgi:hypothetical protein